MACGEYGVEDIEKFMRCCGKTMHGAERTNAYQLQNEIFRVDFTDENA
jgi:hypothetical protein